jgi:predicted  nucleic acid-binding Zn-ribbon protein
MVMEEQRDFERKIMNCTLVLLHTQDQIKDLDVAVPHMKAQEALKRLEMRRNELTEKQHSLETELVQLQAAQREARAGGRGPEDELPHPCSS